MKQRVSEKEAQKAILEWLTAKRIFHYRNNTGGFKDANNHFYRFGALGSPDIVLVIRGVYVAIEVKGSGGKQSEHQEFQRQLEKAGGEYILARSINDVEQAFQEILQRRRYVA